MGPSTNSIFLGSLGDVPNSLFRKETAPPSAARDIAVRGRRVDVLTGGVANEGATEEKRKSCTTKQVVSLVQDFCFIELVVCS